MKRSGFTLIELLIVIAIIAILISLLLPSLGTARNTARAVVCQSFVRQLGQAQQMYMNSFKDQYAGVNTSGAEYQGVYPGQTPVVGWMKLLGDTSPSTPTTTFDWISPILGDSANLPVNRARRTQALFNQWRCPAAGRMNDTLFGTANDRSDFERAIRDGGFRQVSYLSPSAFHYYSRLRERSTPRVGTAFLQWDDFGQPCVTPKNFEPRLDRVGIQPSSKILIADGTRYWTGQVLDFDVAPAPNLYGSFTDPGPIFDGSTAYGKSPEDPRNGWKFSLRHPSNSCNAVFFDGHAARVSYEDAFSDVKLWYPGGSIFNGARATREARARYPFNHPIP